MNIRTAYRTLQYLDTNVPVVNLNMDIVSHGKQGSLSKKTHSCKAITSENGNRRALCNLWDGIDEE